jgi:hypothetical protein
LIFLLGRCDLGHQGVELRAIGGANAVRFRLLYELFQATFAQRIRQLQSVHAAALR